MHHPLFSYEQARKTNLVQYLEKLGYTPHKIRNDDYWYLSPFRKETEASFKVNDKLNAWYDHGLGRGGNIVDFGMLYHKCSYNQLVEKLEKDFLFHPQILSVQQHPSSTQTSPDALEPKIKVIAAKPIAHALLCRYLAERKIPFEIADKYCQEVHCELNGKTLFAIGFKNNSGGYELRNANFKGSTSPKDVTLVEAPQDGSLTVFEGFFNFLSFHTINKNIEQPLTNFLVLNSLSFFEKSKAIMERYRAVNLYLDRDPAGQTATQKAFAWNKKYIDHSMEYKNHKDLNEFLIRQSQQQKQAAKFRRHL